MSIVKSYGCGAQNQWRQRVTACASVRVGDFANNCHDRHDTKASRYVFYHYDPNLCDSREYPNGDYGLYLRASVYQNAIRQFSASLHC